MKIIIHYEFIESDTEPARYGSRIMYNTETYHSDTNFFEEPFMGVQLLHTEITLMVETAIKQAEEVFKHHSQKVIEDGTRNPQNEPEASQTPVEESNAATARRLQ